MPENQPPPSSLNATRHGCCALTTLILPHESREEFDRLEAACTQTYPPQCPLDVTLLDQFITAEWLLLRSTRSLADIEAQIYAAEPNPLNWTDLHHKTITRFQRYRTANQNAAAKCRKALTESRHFIRQEVRLIIAKERHTTYQLKHKPPPSLQETLDSMKQEAIRLGFRPPDA